MKINTFFASIMLFFAFSCTSNKGPTPSAAGNASECDTVIYYSSNISPIIAAKCAIPGCHVSGDPNGDFTTYSGIKPHLDDGLIKSCVFNGTPVAMPLAGSPPLTTVQMNTLKCWLTQGYPNN